MTACRAGVATVLLCSVAGCAGVGTNVRGSFSCSAPSGVCAPSSVIDDRALALIAGEGAAALPVPRSSRQDAALATGPVFSPGRTLRIVLPARTDARGVFHETRVVRALVGGGGDPSPSARAAVLATNTSVAIADTAAPSQPKSDPTNREAPSAGAVAAARARAAAARSAAAAPDRPANTPTPFVARVEN